MTALEAYLRDLRDIRSTGAGVKETSYYTALSNLLNEVGQGLKPKVRCVLQLANRGAGSPDGGLFTPDQLKNPNEGAPLLGQSPSRGVIEVKGTGDDAWVTVEGEQVTKYWSKYRQVLVTNYRDFVLVGQDADKKPVKLESYRLAADETEFWALAAHPNAFALKHEGPLVEYLSRVMLHPAPLASPKDLAWFLASYARTAKARIEHADLPALATVRKALEDSLGLQFKGEKGDHFFRSTLVQTLFYGIFSAWVLWSKGRPASSKERFEWRTSAWHLRVPMIRSLFEQVATPTKLGPLGLVEVLDWTESTINRVDRDSFFQQFEEGQAVQYFYEPFLEAFDPELRKELGVWYTPPEIVSYMVARVDAVLREELDLPDGLADPNVYVLDPCCGTGSYLVEVLRKIAATLNAKGGDALSGGDLKEAAIKRVFGFEILPAPFVVSHLQIGLLLQNLGAPLDDAGKERAGVYLTNALTGWEPLDPEKEKAHQAMLTSFPELLEERDSAGRVKQQVPILVILGNPPYNAFAGISPSEERGLVDPYKEGLVRDWGIKKFNLDDLYIRFFRLAERRIAEQTGQGVVSFISNSSYLSDPSFVVMRQRFLGEFDRLWLDNMNGDSRQTGKRTKDGQPDPSVFSSEYNKAGIRVGTAVSVMVKKKRRGEGPAVRYREFWGTAKRTDLLKSLNERAPNMQYTLVGPDVKNHYSFRPGSGSAEYYKWPRVADLCAQTFVGLEECRGNSLIDIDRSRLEPRMKSYYDPTLDWESLSELGSGLTRDAAGFKARDARERILKSDKFEPDKVVRYTVRPFDDRWAYYSNSKPLWNRPRPDLWANTWQGNKFLISRFKAQVEPEGTPFFLSTGLFDKQTISRNPGGFPVRMRSRTNKRHAGERQLQLLPEMSPGEQGSMANLSVSAGDYLHALGAAEPEINGDKAPLIWMHTLAIGYSPAYLAENQNGIRQDWPRIPLPGTTEGLEASGALGERVARLLDTEKEAEDVTTGNVRPELRVIGVVSKEGGGQLKPEDLALTAGWGHGGHLGIVMPGQGRVAIRAYTAQEQAAMKEGAALLGLSLEAALAQLGDRTCDVYMNDVAYWRNVPLSVYSYIIGGYQVIKKWLSYREKDLLGRPLSNAEVRQVQGITRRIAAILLLQPTLDDNYRRCKEDTYQWPR